MGNRIINISLLLFLTIILVDSKGQEKLRIWEAPINEDRFMITLNHDDWLGQPAGMETRLPSLGVSSYIMYGYPLGKYSPFSFAWGYGFSSHNVHFNGVFELGSEPESGTVFRPFPTNYSYRKHKISATYLEIPIEFRIRSRGDNTFKLFVGARGGYLVNLHTKTADDEEKRKLYGVDHVMHWRYGLTAKIGVDRVTLNAFYSLTPLFHEGRGPQLVPYSVGLSFYLL